ncbi:MAG: septal ring lytic transglycosylase RlpA family protein [Treponema sp.]|nr:septal ring lytic transglycosylase RlpA family protein [Treponema sp.]MBR6913682.1 septal ring lytic transglycosylase RlpA family protein [Treponema sp.]
MKKIHIAFLLLLTAFSTVSSFAEELFKSNVTASYYADKFHGKKTSSGETFNMYAFTAAHKTLPFNTIVKVTNLLNGKSVNVRINDRGPFSENREIDVSKAAAEKLDMVAAGTAQVSLEIVQLGDTVAVETSAVPSTTASTSSATDKINKLKKLDPNKRWDIQLGAFAKRENAESLAQRLVDAGFKNVVFQRTTEVTRVVIKDVPTNEVQDALTNLENKGFNDYFVRERKAESLSSTNPSSIPTDSDSSAVDAK